MYRNVLKTHFLNAQYLLENDCMAFKFSLEIHMQYRLDKSRSAKNSRATKNRENPTNSHYLQFLRSTMRTVHPVSSHHSLHRLLRRHPWVGLRTEGEDLPHHHSIGPSTR